MKQPGNYNEIINTAFEEIREQFNNEFSDAEIRQLAIQMIYYLENGAPYGDTVDDFYRWYKERGGTIDENHRD